MRSSFKFSLLLFFSITFISGCGSPHNNRYQLHQDRAPGSTVDVSNIPDAIPKNEPRSQYGNPNSYKVRGKTYYVKQDSTGYSQRGVASWYGQKFHGHRTSSGETYDMYAMSAAHTSLPLPTYARVTHLENGHSVIVKINDRGPFHDNRLIDLSYAAAKKLGITAKGTGIVEVTAIDPSSDKPRSYKTSAKTHTQTPPAQTTDAQLQYSLYLQAGAFVSRSNAEQLRSKLQSIYNQRKITASYYPNNQLYRVRIGPLASIEEADKLADDISHNGLSKPHIVID